MDFFGFFKIYVDYIKLKYVNHISDIFLKLRRLLEKYDLDIKYKVIHNIFSDTLS